MSHSEASALVAERTSAVERLAAGVVGVGLATILFSVLSVTRILTEETSVLGIGLYDFLAVGVALMGVGVVALGAGSRAGVFESTPDETPGLVTAALFGGGAFVVAGLTASQTLGFGTVGWLLLALLSGGFTLFAVALAPEDVGSTLPAGVAAVGVAALVVGDVVGPSFAWQPDGFSATFTGAMSVPVLLAVIALVAAWAAAKAYEGYGSQGRQTAAYLLVGVNAVGIIAVLGTLLLFIAMKGAGPAFRGFSLVPFEWPFVQNGYSFRPDVINGVFPAIMGTIWLVIGAVVTGVPLAVAAAVFLTEYAEQGRFVGAVEIATNGLWSTPSVVYGLFGYAFLVPRLGGTTSLLSGMLVLGFMLLPLCLITSREALKSVPDEYRDASAALGVSKWQTIRSVVIPAAVPGILTGVILGVGRIAGETAPILLVMSGGLRDPAPNVLGAFEFTTTPPFVANEALLQSAPALPYQLYATITAGVSAENAAEYGWGTAFVLLAVVLSFYAIGIASRIYFRRKLNA
ncbi:phosphate ABC transporter permease PstA [Haloarcula salinisoli]|uniref:Phosphate transport system permease protein PstA n=1 Tax=Haloarcula salinisoli TaxID=2487746 RepID=A0A8J8C8L9_9EURY|nr:phosphate ABC transporter permease PstA [Halomicroarcula salinisoli]MBX0287178.1 phosphate ABC transporter permease PstA [Halomicroarcula salinisoli]MBX0304482.1 phosphate ABC transporter permease PstA [Halomicroarcula salinisoli]